MISEKEIEGAASEYVKISPLRHIMGGHVIHDYDDDLAEAFNHGAKWMQEKNTKEIESLKQRLEIVGKQFKRMHDIACEGYEYYDDETEKAVEILAKINTEKEQ